MAFQIVKYSSPVIIPATPCGEVYLCLNASGAAKTVGGTALIKAVVDHDPRILGPKLASFFSYFFDPRGSDKIQYTLRVDNAQLLPGEVLTCADICELFPYACTLDKILAAI